MRHKILVKIILICIVCIINAYPTYAAVSITDTLTPYTNITIGEAYVISKDMTSSSQGLESTTVNTHMANNKDWATISYFSNGAFGTDRAGANTGVQITTDVGKHYSSNGNITGVMDWGKTYTITAGILENRLTTAASGAGAMLISAYGIDNIVESFSGTEQYNYTYGRTGWYNCINIYGTSTSHPFSLRQGFFGFCGGAYGTSFDDHLASGAAYNMVTFRPMIYNH